MLNGNGSAAPSKKAHHHLNRSIGSFSPSFIKAAADSTPTADLASEAKFGERRWVWVKDAKNGFLKAWIVQEEGDNLRVRCTDDTVIPCHNPLWLMLGKIGQAHRNRQGQSSKV
jgi:hypothetical protein